MLMMYRVQAWKEAFHVKIYLERIIRVQRCMLLRGCGAYRTVSNKALSVVTGIVPIDLLAEEKLVYGGEDNIRERLREEKLVLALAAEMRCM